MVVSINGRPTPNEDEATAVGAAAWMSGAALVRADVVRDNRTAAVTLELPTREWR